MFSDEQTTFLEALERSLGVVSIALQQTNTQRETYDAWLKQQNFKLKVESINELSVDYVENKLLKKIKADDLNAIQFYLRTKGKKRGY